LKTEFFVQENLFVIFVWLQDSDKETIAIDFFSIFDRGDGHFAKKILFSFEDMITAPEHYSMQIFKQNV